MAFLRSVSTLDALPHLYGNGLQMRLPASGDYAEWAE